MPHQRRAICLALGLLHAHPALGAGSDASYGSCVAAVRAAKLQDYDSTAPPTSQRKGPYKAGTDVQIELRIFKVVSVDMSQNMLEMAVWFRLRWSDERLAWDPSAYGGCKSAQFVPGVVQDLEAKEIWTPDVALWNARQGLSLSLEQQLAQVSHTGDVFWSRPGSLVVLCRFSGIANFPFDSPRCEAEMGGWVYSGAIQGISSTSTVTLATERTALPAYSEFNLTNVSCEVRGASYEYEDFATEGESEPWPTAFFTFTLRRVGGQAWQFLLIVPNVLLALLSCAASFLPADVGERLGFGITLILAIEVTRIVMSQTLPNWYIAYLPIRTSTPAPQEPPYASRLHTDENCSYLMRRPCAAAKCSVLRSSSPNAASLPASPSFNLAWSCICITTKMRMCCQIGWSNCSCAGCGAIERFRALVSSRVRTITSGTS